MVSLFGIFRIYSSWCIRNFFSEFFLRTDTRIQNPVKPCALRKQPKCCLSLNYFHKSFAKYFILDVWLGSEYYYDRRSHRTCSVRKGVLRNFAKFTRKYMCQSPFFNKLAGMRTLAEVLSCEFLEISKNTFFTDHRWETGSAMTDLRGLFSILSNILGKEFFRGKSSCLLYLWKWLFFP